MFAITLSEARRMPMALRNRHLSEAVLRDDQRAVSIMLRAGADKSRTREWKGRYDVEHGCLEEVAIQSGSHLALATLLRHCRPEIAEWSRLVSIAISFDQRLCVDALVRVSPGERDSDIYLDFMRDMISRGYFGARVFRLSRGIPLESIHALVDFARLLGRDVEASALERRLRGR